MKSSGQNYALRLGKLAVAVLASLPAHSGFAESQDSDGIRLAQATPPNPAAISAAAQPSKLAQAKPDQAQQPQAASAGQVPANAPSPAGQQAPLPRQGQGQVQQQRPATALPANGQRPTNSGSAAQGQTLKSVPAQTSQQDQGRYSKKSGAKALKKSIRKAKRKETTDTLAKRRLAPEEPTYYVAGGGQLLPAKILRFSYVLQNVSGTSGFDESGGTYDVGTRLNVTAHAFAVEYGITDKITFQILIPIIGSNDLTIDAKKFRRSKEYEEQYQELVETIAPSLIASGRCTSVADCRDKIDAGLSLGIDAAFELPTGEKTIIGANVPLRDAADSLIMTAVEPANGKTGLGDVTLALAYNFITSPTQIFTIGAGLRLPSGAYTDVPSAFRAPGSGFLTLGAVAKYDYRIAQPLMFSLSHQAEYYLNKAVRKRSSALDPTRLNTEDPSADDPLYQGEGDGVANDAGLERKGLGHNGSVRLAFGAGALHRYLNPLGFSVSYDYKLDAEYHRGGEIVSEATNTNSLSYTTSIEGFAFPVRVPVSFAYTHNAPFSGKNTLIAPSSDVFQFTGYYKF